MTATGGAAPVASPTGAPAAVAGPTAAGTVPHRPRIGAALALVAVTAVWGSTFPLSKDLLTRLPVLDYLAMRYLVAGAALAWARPRQLLRVDRALVLHGLALGGLYCLAQGVQFFGLQRTDATVSAFLLSMYVVFTPLLAAVRARALPRAGTVATTLLATAGVAVMTLRDWQLGPGELLTLVAALLYAVHILLLGRSRSPESAHGLTVVQLLTMAVCFLVLALPGGISLPRTSDVPVFLYLAVVAGAVPLLVQTWAQAHLSTPNAAVLMVLEPVWAAVFGVLLAHQGLDARVVVGGALVVGAALLVVTRLQPRVVRERIRLAE